MSLLETIARWEERLALRRTTVLGITVWMTWRSFQWANDYAEIALEVGNDAVAVAAVIAAVTAPIAVLQGYVFKAYIESKA